MNELADAHDVVAGLSMTVVLVSNGQAVNQLAYGGPLVVAVGNLGLLETVTIDIVAADGVQFTRNVRADRSSTAVVGWSLFEAADGVCTFTVTRASGERQVVTLLVLSPGSQAGGGGAAQETVPFRVPAGIRRGG